MKETPTGRYRLIEGFWGGVRVEVEVARLHEYDGGGYAPAPMGADETIVWRRARASDLVKLGTQIRDA